MINLNALKDIAPGPFFSKNTIFHQLDIAAAFGPDIDFDISFIGHMQYGPIKNVALLEVLWSEGSCRAERIQFQWEEWFFTLEVYTYGISHDCPYCRCEKQYDYYEAIQDALSEVIWNLS